MPRRSNAAEQLPAGPPPPASARAAKSRRDAVAQVDDDVAGRAERGAAAIERLIAAGVITQRATGDLLDLGPPSGPISTVYSETLQELREDRI